MVEKLYRWILIHLEIQLIGLNDELRNSVADSVGSDDQ